METITTAKNKVFRTDLVSTIRSPERLYIRILGATMAEVAVAFSDKTETIAMKYGARLLGHWTRLVAIVPEGDAIKVILGKE